jgi:mono/diheme cytochrome c family protein
MPLLVELKVRFIGIREGGMRLATFSLIFLLSNVGTNAADYVSEIKPVLQERCYACHGALKQKADLRVDTAEGMLKAGVIKNGELLARLTSTDEDERMPPEAEPLSAAEIEAIRAWIAAGAPAPTDERAEDDPRDHWAFQRIEKPAVPDGQNPIDFFLTSKHAELGLKPQPEAGRGLVIRRLYLDLIGLPPTLDQLETKDSFEKITQQLLASPQHGERWGRHWMDIWRYSDWYGLSAQIRNSQKHIWRWRDWIVDSLNNDKGYDRMVLEMLAGDELEPENPDVIAGTGFLARNYYLFNRTTWLDDTIEHTGKAFLGLTLNCAKCHDHKYDPIEQNDYYRFRAIFEPHQVRLDPIPGVVDFEKDGLPRVFDDHVDAETFLHVRGDPKTPDKDHAIEPGVPVILASFAPEAKPIDLPVSAWAPGTRKRFQDDLVAAAKKRIEAARTAVEKAQSAPKPKVAEAVKAGPDTSIKDGFDAAQPEVWNVSGEGWKFEDGKLVQTQSSRDEQFVRTAADHPRDFEIVLKFKTTGGDTFKSVGVRFDVSNEGKNAHTVYTSAHESGPKVQVSHSVDGTASYPTNGKVARPIVVGEDCELRVQAREQLLNVSLNGEFLLAFNLPIRMTGKIELFAFDATAEFDSIDVSPLASDTELKSAGTVTEKPKTSLEVAEARVVAAEAELNSIQARIAADNAVILGQGDAEPAKLAAAKAERAFAAAKTRAAHLEKPADAKLKTAFENAEKALTNEDTKYTSIRGSFKALETPEHKEPHYAATYAKTSTGRRLALAKWMVDRENPLTARVAVNHIWTRHFGEPLVESVFDFGRRAKLPDHAELLDFLAVELIESGWSMKHLHELIVTSRAYRLGTSNLGADPDTFAKDPTNRFYWRMNSRRMESQVVRDSLLQLAAQLDPAMGGPSIEPAPDARRRGLYFKHSRDHSNLLHAMFDDANHLACYRRSQSVVPQQALALSNSKLSIDMAQQLLTQLGEIESNDAFAARAFEALLCRQPSDPEMVECRTFFSEMAALSGDQARVRARFVHALLNHNDFVTIR